jgi:long-chain acyl-CoA synthetase
MIDFFCRNKLSETHLVETFEDEPEVRTLYDLLERAIARYGEEPYLGKRQILTEMNGEAGDFEWISYEEVGQIRNAVGSGLRHLGVGVGSGETVGLYSLNSVDWMLVDAAVHAYGMIAVPLYDTLGPDAVKYITNHAELSAIACSLDVLGRVMEVMADCPCLKVVVVYGTKPHQRLPEGPSGSRARIITLDRVRALGYKYPKPHRPPLPDDTALINYTSGTTGVPKGAVLTHRALIANVAGSAMVIRPVIEKQKEFRHISYLPLAHIYERFNVSLMTFLGGGIGFYRGNVLDLLDDVEALKPTTFASVPRLYNRIYDKVLAQIEGANPIARRLFWTAFNYKKKAILQGDLSGGPLAPLWDKLVFSKIRAKLGGKVHLLSSGASPISSEVFLFLRVCFGENVLEGYGMTETACLICLTPPGDASFGHVGPPIPSCEVKLCDIPEMGYLNEDLPNPRGEICVRGPIVFSGYYKNPEATSEAIDQDGWLHTGDVGTWLPGGRLKIIDRKKNIFKLAQGEYIAPEKIENIYARSSFVLQAFVYGDSLQAQLVAIVVPDPEYLLPWAAQRGLPQDLEQLSANNQVIGAILKSIQEEGRAAGLKGFEQVAAIRVTPEPFSVENNLMTPTFKVKRPQAKEAFKHLIEEMYASL